MDEENVKRKKLEDAAWYQSDFGVQLTKGKKGVKDNFLAPEDIYKLDDDHTYKTLNERPGTYKGLPGAATLDLGKVKAKPKEVDLTREEDHMSVMTNATNFPPDVKGRINRDVAWSKDLKQGFRTQR